jgi:hypothetical protein
MSASYFDLLKGFLRYKGFTNDVSVEAALLELGIPAAGTAHRALDDARMTAEVFIAIFESIDYNHLQQFKDTYTNAKERRIVKNAVRTLHAQKVVPDWELLVERFLKDKIVLDDVKKVSELQRYFEVEVDQQQRSTQLAQK